MGSEGDKLSILCDQSTVGSMTRRFSISLPDDVAAELDRVDNASAYIAEAIRLRRRHETTRQVLANAGYQVTEDGIQRMRERVLALEARRRQVIEAGGE
jgi:metal-responsive CopG/Arc/MetJ family transcriptional regulator